MVMFRGRGVVDTKLNSEMNVWFGYTDTYYVVVLEAENSRTPSLALFQWSSGTIR